ncbi:hypothetical protein MMC13_003016 [Lambiella insularis]|nr:hypothetical protein [Lambiella insularis]
MATMATAAPTPAPATPSIIPPRLPAGEYAGYFDGSCSLEDGNNFPIVNFCHALPDDSIIVSNQACGVGKELLTNDALLHPILPSSARTNTVLLVEIFTDDNCQDNAQTVALGVCTDTSFYSSLKVVCQ